MQSSNGEIQATGPQEVAEEVIEEVADVAREYSSQADYIQRVSAAADERAEEVVKALRA